MSKNLLIKLGLFVFLVSCFAGTALAYQAYDGPKKPDGEVAFLKSKTPSFVLFRIDDVSAYNLNYGFNNLNDSLFNLKIDAALLPGQHELEIVYYIGMGGKGKTLVKTVQFNAEAGKTYWIDQKQKEFIIYNDLIKEGNQIEIIQNDVTPYHEPTGTDFAVLTAGGKKKNSDGAVLVHRIDGMWPYDNKWNNKFNDLLNRLNLKLTPGEHKLAVSVDSRKSRTVVEEMLVNVEAGKTYTFEVVEKENEDGNGVSAIHLIPATP